MSLLALGRGQGADRPERSRPCKASSTPIFLLTSSKSSDIVLGAILARASGSKGSSPPP
ncbi:hypothetical protein LguiA_002775 [Lonicera macranthoides]